MIKIFETRNISTPYEMKSFFAMIRELFLVIDAFIGTHEMVNESISNNECYLVVFGTRKTVFKHGKRENPQFIFTRLYNVRA